MRTRLHRLLPLLLILMLVPLGLAHQDGSQYEQEHMMDWCGEDVCHPGMHWLGYGMFGMGWFGMLFGVAAWVLVILGIIYLYQRVTEKDAAEG